MVILLNAWLYPRTGSTEGLKNTATEVVYTHVRGIS